MNEDEELNWLVEIELTFDDPASIKKRNRLLKEFCDLKGLKTSWRNPHNDRVTFMNKHYPLWRGYKIGKADNIA